MKFNNPYLESFRNINSGTHVVDFRMARALAEFGTHKKIIGRERHSAASFAN